MSNLFLITGITESNLQHAPVVERIGGQRAVMKSEVTLLTEAADGAGERKARVGKNNLIEIQKPCSAIDS